MRAVRFSNEMALIILLVIVAIIWSIVDFVKQNPVETLAIIAAIWLWRNRHKIHMTSNEVDKVEQ
jgi:hypothetical protein